MKCDSTSTRSKTPCGYTLEQCPYGSHALDSSDPARHGSGRGSGRGERTVDEPQLLGPAPEQPVRALPEAVAARDVRQLAWWTIGALIDGSLEARDVAALCTLIRTLHTLGPEPEEEEAILAEIELRGVVMNGFPPRNDEEWALAERVFDADALAEFHRWEATGHGW